MSEQIINKKNKRIKLLFLCDEILSATGGSEQHLAFLLNNLPKESYDIHLAILRQATPLNEIYFSANPVFVNFESFRSPLKTCRAIVKLLRFIRQRNIEVVQCFFPDSELLGACISAFPNHRAQIVISRRDLGYDDGLIKGLKKRIISSFPVNYLANCDAVKRYLVDHEGVRLGKISAIYNPINPHRLLEGENQANRTGNAVQQENSPKVGIIANIRPVKDYPTFLRAARIISDTYSGVKFIVIGDDTSIYAQEIKKLASELKLSERVFFKGSVDNPSKYLRTFDIGVLTSTSEGLSNSLIEYGAAGIPSVATDVGGSCEIIVDGKTGILVPPRSPKLLAQAITALLKCAEIRKLYGEQAKRFVNRKFSSSEIIRQYQTYHSRLIRKDPG